MFVFRTACNICFLKKHEVCVNQKITYKKILVVDDEADMRVFLSTVVETGGFDPIVAANSEQGLEKASKDHPDLIILDMMMSQEDGIQMYWALKCDDLLKRIPVIMLSSIDKETFFHYQKMKSVPPGKKLPEPEAYLEKPPEADELIGLIHEMLIKKRIENSITKEMK